jgi:hypothetical protein
MPGFIVAVLIASQGYGAAFKPESPDPVLWISAKQYDFGAIPASAEVTHALTIQNRGGKTLVISRVATTCGCATGIPGRKSLQPGESTEMTLHFDPRDKIGPVARTLSIFCNDPANPQQLIYVMATVGVDSSGKPIKAAATAHPPIPEPPPATPVAPGASKTDNLHPPAAAVKPPMPEEPAHPPVSPAPPTNPSEVTLPDE